MPTESTTGGWEAVKEAMGLDGHKLECWAGQGSVMDHSRASRSLPASGRPPKDHNTLAEALLALNRTLASMGGAVPF